MKRKQQITVKFIDGPLDGHTRPYRLTHRQLNEVVAIPINPTILATLKGHTGGSTEQPTVAATSVAVYSRDVESQDDSQGEARYQYLGPAHPHQFPMVDRQ